VTAFNVLHHVDGPRGVCTGLGEFLAPGGVFISRTACLRGRVTLVGILVMLPTDLRIMPRTRFFRVAELESLIASVGFDLVESATLSPLPERLIVARKA
jgi:hypothetical protein